MDQHPNRVQQLIGTAIYLVVVYSMTLALAYALRHPDKMRDMSHRITRVFAKIDKKVWYAQLEPWAKEAAQVRGLDT